jgi:parallel beta-helix repeat protein
MMHKKGVLLGTSVVLALVLVLLASGQVGQDVSCWTDRETIYIYGNTAFTSDNGVVSGCGTKESPYVIEGWRIITLGADFGINIERTSQYFVIRNCVVEGASGAAIRLYGVSNGAIEECQLLHSENGILLENAHYNSIVGNLIAENRTGAVMALESRENTVTKNSFVLNGRSAHDPGGRNLWYHGLVGNYWSDYEGDDENCDGIGDQPYTSPVVDRYPLIASPGQCTLPITELPASHCATSTTVIKEVAVVSPPCASPPCGSPQCPRPGCAPACSPVLTVCADQILTCADPAVTLSADFRPSGPSCQPYSVEWTRAGFGIVGDTPAIVVSEPGTYTVTITGGDHCSVSDTVVVVADFGTPLVTATVERALSCAFPEVTLESHVSGGCSPYALEWMRGGVVIGRDSTVTVRDPGTYTVRVTSGNGCSSSASVDVAKDVGAPVVEAAADRLLSCAVTETDLRAKATGGSPPYTYEWRDATQRVMGSDPVVTVNRAGTYTVRVTGHNGCSSIADVIVPGDVETPVVSALVDGVITCDVEEVTLTANISRGRPPYAIEWATPRGITICRSATIIANEAGTYTVTVTGANGCSSSDSVVVVEDTEPPLVDAGSNQALTLETPEVVLTATIDRCPGPYTVTWVDTLGEVVGHAESLTVSRSGVYTVTVVRDTGCSASDEVTVTSDYVSEVVLTSDIEGLAVFGQLTMDGVPIPESVFYFLVDSTQTGSEGAATTITMTNLYAEGYRANGAEVFYIIPGNETVAFGIHKEQFIAGKKYHLLHLPTDPPGEAAVAFF